MLAEYRGNAVTISREAITKNLTLISLSLLLILNIVNMIMSYYKLTMFPCLLLTYMSMS